MRTDRGPVLTSTLWGDAAIVGAVVVVVLGALPFYPDTTENWEGLAWLFATAMVAAGVALVAGAVAVHHGLRRGGHPNPLATALLVVPVAAVLGVVAVPLVSIALAPVAALAAPPVAAWLVQLAAPRSGANPRTTTPA